MSGQKTPEERLCPATKASRGHDFWQLQGQGTFKFWFPKDHQDCSLLHVV